MRAQQHKQAVRSLRLPPIHPSVPRNVKEAQFDAGAHDVAPHSRREARRKYIAADRGDCLVETAGTALVRRVCSGNAGADFWRCTTAARACVSFACVTSCRSATCAAIFVAKATTNGEDACASSVANGSISSGPREGCGHSNMPWGSGQGSRRNRSRIFVVSKGSS